MLITKKIIVPNKSHYKYYLDKGVYNSNDNTIEFDIIHLKSTSLIEVDVVCDICGIEKKTQYYLYNKNIGNYNFYSCKGKCSQEKNKLTNLDKYGVENPTQNKIIKEKGKQTNLEKYGVDNPMKVEKFKNKIKETNLEKYGIEYYSKTSECKEKIKQTNLDKYGVENYSKTKEYLNNFKQTNLEKYGVEHYSKTNTFKDRIKETNLEKYGVVNVFQNEEIKEKIKQTNLEKYGVVNVFQNEEIKEKIKQTNLEKYGVEFYIKSEDYLTKSKDSNINKYGVDNYKKSEESKINTIIGQHPNYIKYINNYTSIFKCDLNKDHEFEINCDNFHGRSKTNLPLCTICYPIGDNKSIKEKILLEYIKSIYNGEIISGYRDGIEIDIYLPELKLGIEFNGLYWHSEKFKDSNYHINKLNWFKERQIDIKFIYEDDFDNNLDIIKSQINNWLGITKNKIYARKCLVKEIKIVEEYRNFLNQNHIQGFVVCNKAYGLCHNEVLVSLMCFDKKEGRLNMEESGWNLNRFCNLLNTNVVGGASKLLNYFIKENKPKRIISYADKDWSNGNLYFKLGFNLLSESKPDYKYIVDNIRKSKQNFTKNKLQKLGHDISLTESQIMENLGINKIYDCGKIKFELISKK